ncbi:MAG: 1,4-alpha-glucan branching enzyme [Parasphingorhabdus sp.]|jgi:1,4-alpha-glucan branching enzyme
MTNIGEELTKIAQGHCKNPFAILGQHQHGNAWAIRCFQPQGIAVSLVDCRNQTSHVMSAQESAGIYMLTLAQPVDHYIFRISTTSATYEIEDPYRFPSALGELDQHLFCEGRHDRLYEKLGANFLELNGVSGVHFALWAPNAERVSVVGTFNEWDGRRHAMRFHPTSGLWDLFVPGLCSGDQYKYEILKDDLTVLPLKADPFARFMQPAPGNASIVYHDDYDWGDEDYQRSKPAATEFDQPVSIYEVHLSSWRRTTDNQYLTYRELAAQLVAYVVDMGFTHIELLPVSEHPFDGSWGYQPVGLFAPTSRFGTPAEFKYFVDHCHKNGIGVILDWVPAHFPKDDFGLRLFDGTHLYEHADPRQGEHQDWGTLIFNYGRNEVLNYLISNACYWVREFHIDALRVDAVASMLYLDYSREAGEWIANQYGSNENLEAIEFLKQMNKAVHAEGAVTMAEESTSWPGVTQPVDSGGLGFSYKWNMGWMHDSLDYIAEDPIHRRHHHQKLTFGQLYAYSENFILPLSHDEVVHGKRSLLGRMPGDDWQRFANLRAYLSYLYTHPGKKMLFMGMEIAQQHEWQYQGQLDWGVLDHESHSGIQTLVRDLNLVYRSLPPLYDYDCRIEGFQWINADQADQSILSFLRKDRNGKYVVVIINFSPQAYHGYRIGVPRLDRFVECLNSDAQKYGGSNVINSTGLDADRTGCNGLDHSLTLTLAPLACIILKTFS